MQENLSTRRDLLWQFGGGLGGVALMHLLGRDGVLAESASPKARAELNGGIHHKARARRVIQLFMNGGVSQMDTFDFKPELERLHGQPFDPGSHVEAPTSQPGTLMKCPFPFAQHGECGRWVSSVFPETAKRVDDLAFLMALASKTNVHGPASYMMNTGFLLPGFPCLGSWVSFGLGSLSDNLPTFIVLPDRRGLPYNAKGNFSPGFLPSRYQATLLNLGREEPILDLKSAGLKTDESRLLAAVQQANKSHAEDRPDDARLEARIQSYQLASRMQSSAPEAIELVNESKATRAMYGLDDPATEDFGRRCLTARRLIERDVRFVQVWSGAGGPSNNWDNHSNIITELPSIARSVDRPIAGLLADLEGRGLLDDTLVVWSTEFGRMPFTQGATGRDHNGGTSVAWLAGAGIRGGVTHGQTDHWSWQAAENRTYCYDLHATILHLLGIDHERLTVRHNGIDRRLTDVHGHVVQAVLN